MTAAKRTYRLSSTAFLDLQEIEAYIADDSPAAAERVIDAIEAACDMLTRAPQAGRKRPELDIRLRSFVVGSYIIFYNDHVTPIDVIRVLHSRRDIDALF